MPRLKLKRYLGDGLYGGLDEHLRVWLFTTNGVVTTNEICLEDHVLTAFSQWIAEVGERMKDKDLPEGI